MKIIVLIKQVPKEDTIKFDEKGNLVRENIELTLNKADEYAIENALILKEKFNFKTIAITMGPPQAQEIIRYSLSKGIDEGYIISDFSLKGSDAYITAITIADSIVDLFDDKTIIFTGEKSEDGDTGIVPSMIAEHLKIPSVLGAETVEFENEVIIIKRKTDDETQKISIKIPCLISFSISSLKLRTPSIKYKIKSKSYIIKNIFKGKYSGQMSPTYIKEIRKTEIKTSKNTEIIDIKDEEKLLQLKKMIYE